MKKLLILFVLICLSFSSVMGSDPEVETLRKIIDEKSAVINDINRSVWEYAEIRYQEFKSAAKIIAVLEAEGFKVEKELVGIKTAFRATYGSGSPVVGFLAEYDALANLGQKGGSSVKTPISGQSNGHGCGHSVLGAAAVGGAIAVKEYLKKHPMSGTIVLYGTPAEEGGCGKTFMVKRGCFRELDVVFSWHPSTRTGVATGRTLANYKVKYTFDGISAHASAKPDAGRSALDAAELMNVGVNYLREHVPMETRIHYAWLNGGGNAPNVVQDHTELLYYIRARKVADCDQIMERVNNIARGAALMTGTNVTIKCLAGLSDFQTNSVVASILHQALCEMGPPSFGDPEYTLARDFMANLFSDSRRKMIIEQTALAGKITPEEFAKKPLDTSIGNYNPKAPLPQAYGSTDDGDVSQIVPAARFHATNAVPGSKAHSWEFTAQTGSCIGDRCAQGAARIFARAAILIFKDPEIVKPAKAELLRTTGGKYKCPVPDDAVPGEF